jgi:hypothetical protein
MLLISDAALHYGVGPRVSPKVGLSWTEESVINKVEKLISIRDEVIPSAKLVLPPSSKKRLRRKMDEIGDMFHHGAYSCFDSLSLKYCRTVKTMFWQLKALARSALAFRVVWAKPSLTRLYKKLNTHMHCIREKLYTAYEGA